MIGPEAESLGLEIVRLRVMGGSRRKRMQIMAERGDGTMGVEDCATLSRALSALLEVNDPFEEAWDLEVSSPGIDRPLTKLSHFARWQGFDVRLELDRLVDGQKRFSGILAGVEDDAVLLDTPELEGAEESLAIPFDWLVDARLVLTDALIAESLNRGAAQPAEALDETQTTTSEHQSAAAETAASPAEET